MRNDRANLQQFEHDGEDWLDKRFQVVVGRDAVNDLQQQLAELLKQTLKTCIRELCYNEAALSGLRRAPGQSTIKHPYFAWGGVSTSSKYPSNKHDDWDVCECEYVHGESGTLF